MTRLLQKVRKQTAHQRDQQIRLDRGRIFIADGLHVGHSVGRCAHAKVLKRYKCRWRYRLNGIHSAIPFFLSFEWVFFFDALFQRDQGLGSRNTGNFLNL